METKQQAGISFFQKYLTVWVLLCMAAGILIGHFIPSVPETLGRMEISGISIPIHTDRYSDLDHDLSDDDQGGFPKRKRSREKSQRALCYMDRKLADQAVYDVRICLAVSFWGV